MKILLLLPLLLTNYLTSSAQIRDTSRISRAIPADQLLAPLNYLASDHLRGRHVGLPEIDTAANYIARQFQLAGAKPLNGATGYFQLFTYKFDRFSRYFRYDPQASADMPPSAFLKGLALKNVIAFIRGTDTLLRRQYIVLSSHYDHVGVADSAVMEDHKMDSIFNGARDNATGTAAVIAAARYFARFPSKRSVLFICYTAEEEGDIGSEHYAAHPLIPLYQTVFNLNVDNASYNTTHAICLFGLGRTSADSFIYKAAGAYGMAVLDDPLRGALFGSSDNASLASQGIPAPTFSMGMTNWDSSILNRYHRLSDEVRNMDLGYVVRFIRAYILAAQYIADDPVQPKWTYGDPNELTWETLFKINRDSN